MEKLSNFFCLTCVAMWVILQENPAFLLCLASDRCMFTPGLCASSLLALRSPDVLQHPPHPCLYIPGLGVEARLARATQTLYLSYTPSVPSFTSTIAPTEFLNSVNLHLCILYCCSRECFPEGVVSWQVLLFYSSSLSAW